MVKFYVYMILFLSIVQQLHSQEDGVVALALPVRNSLKFNKYNINPTFSFVREQNRYISFTNKREWVQFDNAPQTYLFSYSGRFTENSGIAVGLFQQNYGVLTTFGGVLNYAYNVVLDTDSNLTFGMNLGVYKSGINEGNVITNFPDPSLDNIPSNTVITVNPGINYGTAFFDFGISINNLAAYNFTTSKIIEENPEQSVQGHIMYTGYVDSRGFFDETKFSGLVRSEFKKDKTVLSGIAMFTVPKGFWAQAGYNTLYGLSGGVGFNISNQIALEYNYEKSMGELSTFGSSHEITLAYKFKNNNRYRYSGDDEESALIKPSRKPTRQADNRITTTTPTTVPNNQTNTIDEELAQTDEEASLETEQETQAILAAEAQARAEEEARIKLEQEQEEVRVQEETRLKAEQETQARLAAEAQVIAQEEARLKAQEEARIKLAEEQAQARADEEARIKLAEEQAQVQVEEENDPNIGQVDLDNVLLEAPGSKSDKAMAELTRLTVDNNIEQRELLIKLQQTIANREQDLKDLKEENDLSEQGIYSEPKPFKSLSAENAALESLKLDLDNIINAQNIKINQLENLYNERLKSVPNVNDSINTNYLRAIKELKSEQLIAINTKESLLVTLEEINVATEIERKRRIKRAVYDNEEDRYAKDRAALNVIKENTPLSTTSFKVESFDFGEEQSANIKILKGVNNVDNGFYLVLAVHEDVIKRDDFLTKVVASGQSNIDFFYDVNTSKYYIYYEKFNSIEAANNALRSKGSEPYKSKMSMVKIEN